MCYLDCFYLGIAIKPYDQKLDHILYVIFGDKDNGNNVY